MVSFCTRQLFIGSPSSAKLNTRRVLCKAAQTQQFAAPGKGSNLPAMNHFARPAHPVGNPAGVVGIALSVEYRQPSHDRPPVGRTTTVNRDDEQVGVPIASEAKHKPAGGSWPESFFDENRCDRRKHSLQT